MAVVFEIIFMNNNKYNYPILERVDTEIGRHYLDSNNKAVPSVTTILSGTSQSKAGMINGDRRLVMKRQIELLNKAQILVLLFMRQLKIFKSRRVG